MELHLLTDRYLQGTLSEAETAEFEERLLWDSELVDELDIAQQLRDGLRAAGISELKSAGTSPGGFLRSIWAVPQYAAAASFLLAVALTSLVFLGPAPSDMARGASSADIVPLEVVRSSSRPTVMFKSDRTTVLLVGVFEDYENYRVTIYRDGANAAAVWVDEAITPTYLDALAISIPPGFLAAGAYTMTIEGQVNAGGESQFIAGGQSQYIAVQQIPFEARSED
jgi:hypothetical protein